MIYSPSICIAASTPKIQIAIMLKKSKFMPSHGSRQGKSMYISSPIQLRDIQEALVFVCNTNIKYVLDMNTGFLWHTIRALSSLVWKL